MLRAPQILDNVEQVIPAFSPTLNASGEFLNGLPSPQRIGPRRELICKGERAKYVRFVRSGVIKLTSVSDAGQEGLSGLRSEGYWAGASSALVDMESLYTVTTVVECEISSIPVDSFISTLMQNQRLLRHFIAAQSRDLLVEQQHGILNTTSAANRLTYLQNEIAQSRWKTIDPFTLMKQCKIANLLSMTPEHLSRLMHAREHKISSTPQAGG